MSATHAWLEDIERNHLIQYDETGPILVDEGEIPRSIQGNHMAFLEFTLAPWYDISKESQDRLVVCTLDHCARMEIDNELQVDRALAENLRKLQGVVVGQIPDPFDTLARMDKEPKAPNALLKGEIVKLPNELILVAQNRFQMSVGRRSHGKLQVTRQRYNCQHREPGE